MFCSKSHACILFITFLCFSSSNADIISDQLQNLPSPQGVVDGVVSSMPDQVKNLPQDLPAVAKAHAGEANGVVSSLPDQVKQLPAEAKSHAGELNGVVSSLPDQFHKLPTQPDVINGLFSLRKKEMGLNGVHLDSGENSNLILAANRTNRKDPLNGNKRYTGGWNISNEHYWASVANTATPLFVTALVWFLAFGLVLLLMCCCCCCCRREPYGYSRVAYAISLILLVVFTVAAIIGSVYLYTGQGRFHGSTSGTLKYVVKQANITLDNLRDVSDDMSVAKQIGVRNITLPSDILNQIDDISTKVTSTINSISGQIDSNSDKIQHVLDEVRVSLMIIAALMLCLAFIGFLLSILGMQCLVHTLVIIGWILVTLTFVLAAIFLLLHNVVADTCVAMDEWVQHPTAHTALDNILPCVDAATANETLLRTKEVSYGLVDVVNQVITNVSNLNFTPNFPVYYNQSGPLVPVLCNPYNPDLTDRTCAPGEVELSNATQVWKDYICQASEFGFCTTAGRLTPDLYQQMTFSANLSFVLSRDAPFLIDLVDCTFVREIFNDISNDNCPGLRKYSKWTYAGLTMVSVSVMLSLIFWVIYARERRHRVYTKKFMA